MPLFRNSTSFVISLPRENCPALRYAPVITNAVSLAYHSSRLAAGPGAYRG